MAALRAAVAAGADAVYLGLDAFNARRGAENFTLETLPEALRFAHLRGRRVYLTMNVLVLPDEMDRALAMIDQAWAMGVDAVIVQDLGLLGLVRSLMPDVRLHASTQLNAHSTASALALARAGASRVTLARELSLEEIARISAAVCETGAEVETFTHGALCMCYSGQCLLSSMVGGRSANRGECAQPCRLPYELVDEAGRVLADVGAHLLSPKDLAAIQVLPRLIASGTSALKLEGRMKSAEYVALVTGVYRAALDRAAEAPDAYEVRDGETSVLAEAFSRGFTEGYLIGERGNDMMSYSRPNNRGVLIGRISSADKGAAAVEFGAAADPDDTIEVWTSRGRFTARLGDVLTAGARGLVAAGSRVEASFPEPVGVGDRVFRVRNAALSEAARRLYEDRNGARVPLAFSVRMVKGSPLVVSVTDEHGAFGSFEGGTVEAARTRPVTAADVSEHVGRLGGTPFSAASWDIELSPAVGISFSDLHAARSAALADYERNALSAWAGRERLHPSPPSLRARRHRGPVRLVAAASDLRTALACLGAGADEAHVPASALPEGEIPRGVVPLLPRICHDAEMAAAGAVAVRAGRAVAGTLGALGELAPQGVDLQAHWSLNVVNEHSAARLAEMGCSLVWLSPELDMGRIRGIAEKTVVPVGVAIAGRQELMVTEHCVLMAEGECRRTCAKCSRRKGTRFLKDRKGYRFPVLTDAQGRTHIYNPVRLDVTHALAEVLVTGVGAVRVDVESEGPAEAADLVAGARSALEAALAGLPAAKERTDGTSGRFFRALG